MTQHIVNKSGGRWSNAAEDRIDLVDPDPAWALQYEAEASALAAVLPHVNGLHLEHFGSTAVPGIRSKPVIDILVIHPERARWPELIAPVSSLGYVYWSENPRTDRMFFVKGMPPYGQHRTHHLHVRVAADAEAELAFRDLLRADPALARRYEELKEDLALRYPNDRDAYTDGKTTFVAEALGGHSRPVIRSARLSDAAAMKRCVDHAYHHYIPRMGKPPGPMLDDYGTVIERHAAFVAEKNGEVVGVLVLAHTDAGMLLDNVAVDPAHQAKGLGRRLIELAETEARRRGCRELTLYTHECMTENIGMYRTLGYVETERRTEGGYRRVYMRKVIGVGQPAEQPAASGKSRLPGP